MNELSWTSAAFTLAFIHLPLLFVACYRPRKLTAVPMKSDPRQRQLIFGLVGATILSDAVIAACWQLAPAIVGHLWILFFPLWFGLAMPWMVRRFPSTGNPHPPTARIRSAALNSREPLRVSRGALTVLRWGSAALLVGFIAWLAMRRETLSPAQYYTSVAMLAAFAITAAVSGLLTPWLIQRVAFEPQPLPPRPAPELQQAWASLLRLKRQGLAVLIFSGPLLTAVLFVLASTPAPPTALIWVGAGGGSLLGIAGGIFGTLIGTRQAALIEQARPSPPPHANHEKLA